MSPTIEDRINAELHYLIDSDLGCDISDSWSYYSEQHGADLIVLVPDDQLARELPAGCGGIVIEYGRAEGADELRQEYDPFGAFGAWPLPGTLAIVTSKYVSLAQAAELIAAL